jgi:hypothetical protein
MLEVDLTGARASLRDYQTRTGEPLSFTAIIIGCVGKAVDENNALHALRLGISRVIQFADVDVLTWIERDAGGQQWTLRYAARVRQKLPARALVVARHLSYTLNRMCIISPSATAYSFPSICSSPASFTACSEPSRAVASAWSLPRWNVHRWADRAHRTRDRCGRSRRREGSQDRGAPAAIAQRWTEDITVRAGLGAALSGRQAYRDAFVADSAMIYTRTPDAITLSSRWPLAYERGHWIGKVRNAPNISLSGEYSAQWVKRGTEWLIRSELFVATACTGRACNWPASAP